MTFRYIGSKTRLVELIMEHVDRPGSGRFVDAFCGTGVVGEAAAAAGWSVVFNDHLTSAVVAASARLTSVAQARFRALGGYNAAIDALNALPGLQGFIWRTYSPASAIAAGVERRYFTEVNAARIDAVRAQVRRWRDDGAIGPIEERLLLADLFGALNRVANIAGTFGCFLSKWTAQSQGSFLLRPRTLKAASAEVATSTGDVFAVRTTADDVVYLDPPYTKRQYASYYHILETVALGDEPAVEGVAGLRPWRDRASDFCYKVRALPTLLRLVASLPARRVLLSYSNEGHVDLKHLKAGLGSLGRTTVHPLATIGRYRPNRVASDAGSDVREYLIAVTKPARRSTQSERVVEAVA